MEFGGAVLLWHLLRLGAGRGCLCKLSKLCEKGLSCATPAPSAVASERKAREDPSARLLPTGYVFFLLGASLAMLVLCGIQCKSTFCRTPVRYGGVGSDTIISVSDDPDDEGFEMSGSSSMV